MNLLVKASFVAPGLYHPRTTGHQSKDRYGVVPIGPERMKRETCTHLVWVALFLLIRGHYPENRTQTGRDVPKFLKTNCHMNISPARLAQHMALDHES